MRLSVVVAVACLSIAGLSAAADVKAAIRRNTEIPAQGLGPALQMLAKERGFQIVYVSDEVNSLRTQGASGELTAEEALAQLLVGTGLTFRSFGDNAVSIVPVATAAIRSSDARSMDGVSQSAGWFRRLRLAQVEEGSRSPSSSSSAEGAEPPRQQQLSTLEEVVVTAQKREERLKDVPISIAVLSGKSLDQSTLVGVNDAINSVAGATASISRQGGGTQITIRGVGANAPTLTGASTVAFYLDSVPFGLVKNAILPDPNVYDLERIEVLRGPQGTLYGANAVNGVVRVLTNDADPNAFDVKARTTVSGTDGGGNNYGGDAAINVPLVPEKLAARAVVGYQDSGGWIDGPLGNDVNDSELQSYRLKITGQPTDALSIKLSAMSTTNDYGAASFSTDDKRISATIPTPVRTEYTTYGARIDYEFANFSLSSATSYLDYKNKSNSDLGQFPPLVALRGTPLFTTFYSEIFSEELLLNSADASLWHWTLGAFYRDAEDRLLQSTRILVAPLDYGYTSESYAVFGQIGRRFFENQFEWTLGLRYFHDDVVTKENAQEQGLPNVPLLSQSASFSPVTPRAVLTWYPSADWTLYTSYSEGFRSGFPQDPGIQRAAPNFSPLRPDKLHNYEIGAKGDLSDGRLSFDTAVYYIDWRDVQQVLTVPIGNGLSRAASVNGESASGIGVDLGITARPVDGLELSVAVGWNDLKLDADVISAGQRLFAKGDRLNFSPEWTGSASGAYTFAVGRGYSSRLSAGVNYTSRQSVHLINGVIGPVANTGDTQTIARAELSILAPAHWRAAVFVDNLTNNYGGLPEFGFVAEELRPRPRPRTIGLQLEYRY